jgi:hypothetical protein
MQANEVVLDCFGNAYLEGAAGVGLVKTSVQSVAATKKAYLKGVLGDVCPLDDALEIGGTTTISGSFVVGADTTSAPVVTIGSSVTLPASVMVRGGSVVNSAAATEVLVLGGDWDQAAGDVTTFRTYGGALAWNAGNITTLYAYGGAVTTAGGTGARRVGTVHAYPTASINLDNGVGNIRVTNYIKHLGGTITLPSGARMEEYRDATYAGASDVKLGIAPQLIAPAADVYGDDIYVGYYDRLEVLVQCGATDAAVKCELFKSTSSSHGDEVEITDPAEVAFSASDDNKTKKITLWGYTLAGKTNVRARITVTGGATGAEVAAAYHKFTL